MKEFKFWAIPYSSFQLLILSMPLGIIFIFLFSPLNPFKHYSYIFIVTFILIVLFFLLFVKKVRVAFSETGTMHIYINGKEKIVAEPQHLKHIIGIDIDIYIQNQKPVSLVFSNKEIVLNILELKSFGYNKNKELLRYMIETYNLRKEFYQYSPMGLLYTYRNPAFKGVSVTNNNKSEK